MAFSGCCELVETSRPSPSQSWPPRHSPVHRDILYRLLCFLLASVLFMIDKTDWNTPTLHIKQKPLLRVQSSITCTAGASLSRFLFFRLSVEYMSKSPCSHAASPATFSSSALLVSRLLVASLTNSPSETTTYSVVNKLYAFCRSREYA